jgi:hypothetical protein
LKNAAIGGASAFAFSAVGTATDGHFFSTSSGLRNLAGNTPLDYFGNVEHLVNIAGHAAVGCARFAASSDDCATGATTMAAGAFARPITVNLGGIDGLVVAAMIGGGAEVLGGGKFANGAPTAAFGDLYKKMATIGFAVSAPFVGHYRAGFCLADSNGLSVHLLSCATPGAA